MMLRIDVKGKDELMKKYLRAEKLMEELRSLFHDMRFNFDLEISEEDEAEK